MNKELRQKITKCLKDYLIGQGWPNLSNDQIIQLLPQMWKKMEAQGLTKELESQGFGYAKFAQSAISAKQQAAMKAAFEQRLRNMGIKF